MGAVALDHVVLTVRDLEATVAFYERLGLQATTFAGGRTALQVGNQKLNLHVAGSEYVPHAQVPTPGSVDLCLLFDEDPRGLVEPSEIEVGPVDKVGATGPLRSIYVRDPDGNLIELAVLVDG